MGKTTNRRVLLMLAAAAFAAGGCNPEAGMWLPRNAGSVRALVRDTSGSPVRGAQVMVEMPNSVGGVFWTGSSTNSSGTVTIHGVPEGSRPVDVTPPAGFSIHAAQRVQVVEVQEGRTAAVTFVVTRM